MSLLMTELDEMVLSSRCSQSMLALLVYDYFLTLPDEIRCIWNAKFSAVTVLFTLNRYTIIFYRAIVVSQEWQNWHISTGESADSTCDTTILHFIEALFIVAQLTVAVIMALRLYAVWSCKRRIFWFVLLIGVAEPSINIYRYVTFSSFAVAPPPLTGCVQVVNLDAVAMSSTVLGVVTNAVVLILTWIRTAGIMRTLKLKGSGVSLGMMLLRDGTVYFILILILTACNLAAIKTSPTATQDPNTRQSFVSSNLGTVPQIFNDITYMLLSRFLLNLRSIHYPPTEIPGDTSKQVSEVRFAHTLTANIGAPLETSCSNIEDDNEQVFSSDPITFGISDEEPKTSSSHQQVHWRHRVCVFDSYEGEVLTSSNHRLSMSFSYPEAQGHFLCYAGGGVGSVQIIVTPS